MLELWSLDTTPACEPDQAVSCRLVYDWTGNEAAADIAVWLVGAPLAIVTLVAFALVARWLIHRVVDRALNRVGTSSHAARRNARARTIGSLLKSIVTVVISAILLITVLAEVGINVAPLLASAGVVGLAVGFGAQSLVSDYISGLFMVFEDQYGVGDVVDLGEAVGTIEAVGLRVTRLRDLDGTVWYVRNGEILRVGNMSQTWARAVLDIGVSYSEDVVRVRRVLGEVAHDLWEDEAFTGKILEEPEVWGVEALAADAVTVRVALKTAPLEQWTIARELRERIKARFDAEGIEIPFPQRTIWHRTAEEDPEAVTPS